MRVADALRSPGLHGLVLVALGGWALVVGIGRLGGADAIGARWGPSSSPLPSRREGEGETPLAGLQHRIRDETPMGGAAAGMESREPPGAPAGFLALGKPGARKRRLTDEARGRR